MSRLTDIFEQTARQGGFAEFARKNQTQRRKADKPLPDGAKTVQKDEERKSAFDAAKRKMSGIRDTLQAADQRGKERLQKLRKRVGFKTRDERIAAISQQARKEMGISDEPKRNREAEAKQRQDDRTMSREEYQRRRQAQRNQQPDGPPRVQATPLQQSDEVKVRQLMQRLSPQQSAKLTDKIRSVLGESHTTTLKGLMLEDAQLQQMSSERALALLMKWAEQLSNHRGKLLAFSQIAHEELKFQNDVERQQFRKEMEEKVGRYVSRATNRPLARNTKQAVKQRGQEVGPSVPKFKTREQARNFVKAQGEKKVQRKVVDRGKSEDGSARWTAPRTR